MTKLFSNFLLLCLVLILVVTAVGLRKASVMHQQHVPMAVGKTQIEVETAKTPLQIEKGLSDRVELGSDGMLFYMPQKGKPLFWMKDMQFALDFIWIDGNTVVDITEGVQPPEPNTRDSQLPTYTPKVDVTYVLEVNAGFVKAHAVAVGDVVVLPN